MCLLSDIWSKMANAFYRLRLADGKDYICQVSSVLQYLRTIETHIAMQPTDLKRRAFLRGKSPRLDPDNIHHSAYTSQ